MTKRAKKRIAKRKNRQGGGRAASQEVVQQMQAAGYINPKEAMALAGVRGGTVYGWVARDVLKAPEGDSRAPWIRSPSGANLWLLRDAVLLMRPTAPTPEPAP